MKKKISFKESALEISFLLFLHHLTQNSNEKNVSHCINLRKKKLVFPNRGFLDFPEFPIPNNPTAFTTLFLFPKKLF